MICTFIAKTIDALNLKYIFLFISLSYNFASYAVNNTIILFVDQYPSAKIPKNKATKESLSKKLKQPKFVWKDIIKQHRLSSGTPGILAIHLGNSCISDKDGQLTFPRTFQKPVVHLLVTKGIQPVYMVAPATVHNWMLDKHMPSELYEFSFHKDEDTDLYYIDTKKVPLPKDSMISFDTIIIISDPNNIFVPLGATMTQYSVNLVLPTIYIKKNFDFSYNALYTNSIQQYFEAITSDYKPEEQTIAKIITNV